MSGLPRISTTILTTARLAILVLLALGLRAAPSRAQQATPLQKSDVVRLLTGGTYGESEIAGMIRRGCLSFEPTSRDLENFRALGASDEVVAAVQACMTEARVRRPPAAIPAATPAVRAGARTPPPDLTLFLVPRDVAVSAGDRVEVTAELTWGSGPASGIELELREEGRSIAVATTGARGRATFGIPPTMRPGIRRFSVVAPGRMVEGANVVRVEASAAAGAEAEETGESVEVPEEDWRSMLARADRLSLDGRYGGAEAIFERLVSEEAATRVDVLASYGAHLARTGRHGDAEAVLRRAWEVDPSRVDVRKALGLVKLWQGEYEQAEEWLRGVTEETPEDVEAWRGLGRALAASGHEREARRAFRRADELEGG